MSNANQQLNFDNETSFSSNRTPFTEILKEFEQGAMFIPSFQRDYTWGKEQVVGLIGSILLNRPFGEVILWSTKENMELSNSLLNNKAAFQNAQEKTYLIDGQQRITTLYNLYHGVKVGGTNFKNFRVTVEESPIVYYKGRYTSELDENSVSVHEILRGNISDFIKAWGENTHEKIDIFEKLRYRFRDGSSVRSLKQTNSEIPAYVASEYFVTFNKSGTPLKNFEVFSAQMFSTNYNFNKFVREIQDSLRLKGFANHRVSSSDTCTPLVRNIIESTLSAHKTVSISLDDSNGTKTYYKKGRYMNITNQEFWQDHEKYYKLLTEDVINILKDVFKLYSHRSIPSVAFYPIVYSFSLIFPKPEKEDFIFLKRLVTIKSITKSFDEAVDESISSAIKILLEYKKQKENEGVALKEWNNFFVDELNKTSPEVLVKTDRSTTKKGILMAMSFANPTQLFDGSLVDFSRKGTALLEKNMHHLKPKALFSEKQRHDKIMDNVFNLCFLDAHTNQKVIKDKSPKEYIYELENTNPYFESFKQTQFLNSTALELLKNDEYDEFLLQRAKNFYSFMEKFLTF